MLSWLHAFVSGKADGIDVTLVKPSNWNAQHVVTTDSAVPVVLGATGPGPIHELPISNIMPVGMIAPYAGATAPAGWYLCDGSLKNRITDAVLFAVIGTIYGVGDGSTTFALPDLRGVVLAGQTNMGGSDSGNLSGGAVLGARLGVESEYLAITQMPPQTLTTVPTGPSNTLPFGTGASLVYGTTQTQTVNKVQPTVILTMIIKT